MNKLILTRDTYKMGLPVTGRMDIEEEGARRNICRTLELPWLNNEAGKSCIPGGTYRLVFVMSPRFKRKMWRVTGVPGRDGILIHVANYTRQLRGCIAPGVTTQDIDKDGLIDAAGSGEAMARVLEALSPYEAVGIDFLIIPGKL